MGIEHGKLYRTIAGSLRATACLLLIALAAGIASAENAGPPQDFSTATLPSDAISRAQIDDYADLAVNWMQQYLRIDTTNPPGHEMQAVRWLQKILDAEGIENRAFEFAAGRGDIWARIPATLPGRKRPIILLNHIDVVTSNPARWTAPPFSGAIIDGSMYGRGAQDMKSDAIAQLLVLVMLKREHTPLDRDILFLATADEEVNDAGTDWFIAHHPELLENAEFLLTEGGENPLQYGQVSYVAVDVAEKSPFWLHVVAHGHAGHGSRPLDDSAPNRLLAALNRILAYRPQPRIAPVVAASLEQMAVLEPAPRAWQFRHIHDAMRDPSFVQQLLHDDSLNYMVLPTISLTMMGGARQTNVIPAEAWANLDVRLLPGDDPQQFLARLRSLVADPVVSITPLSKDFAVANSSPIETPLMSAIREVAARYFGPAPVLPRLTSGYTENQRFRKLGIVSYGYSPYTATPEEGSTEHADNERIRVTELRRGFRVLYDVVTTVAGSPRPAANYVAERGRSR